MSKISAVIIAYNEERYIEQCINSLTDVADEIIVVDSFSTDSTPDICKNLRVKFFQQKFLGYKEQKIYAMGLATYDHILSLDADEALSAELRTSILREKDDPKFDGYKINRLNNYCGKWMYHTCLYPERKLRLFDRRKGTWGGINPHDRFILNQGSTKGFLKGHLLHWIYDTIEDHLDKINSFTTISAVEYQKLNRRAGICKMIFPSVWRFFNSYIIKKGFLDGTLGYVVSRNLAYQTYLKYSKLYKLNKSNSIMPHRCIGNAEVLIASANNNTLLAGSRIELNRELLISPNRQLPISVIITTYNQPEWLRKVLLGYEQQTFSNFEVIIADDGSDQETFDLINWFNENSTLNLKHIWHPDKGFRKCIILNKAITESNGDYLIFTDGDCIPRQDFVETHVINAQTGRFLSGGYFKVNTTVSNLISKEDILSNNIFTLKTLKKMGQPLSYKFLKLTKNNFLKKILNTITPTKPTWNGHNVSGWKSDILCVNGYNEDMQYGGLDRELGERLTNKGLRGKHIRYGAICIHLDHPRPYRTDTTWQKNNLIRKNVRANKITWTPNGISKHTEG